MATELLQLQQTKDLIALFQDEKYEQVGARQLLKFGKLGKGKEKEKEKEKKPCLGH